MLGNQLDICHQEVLNHLSGRTLRTSDLEILWMQGKAGNRFEQDFIVHIEGLTMLVHCSKVSSRLTTEKNQGQVTLYLVSLANYFNINREVFRGKSQTDTLPF